MSAYARSPRLGFGDDQLRAWMTDVDLRLVHQERRQVGVKRSLAVIAVKNLRDLPSSSQPGDVALVTSSNTVYTANSSGVFQPGGTIPTTP